MKCYIDVNFTIEEDFTRFTKEEQQKFIDNKELMTAIFRDDLRKRLDYFTDDIKDLNIVITFED